MTTERGKARSAAETLADNSMMYSGGEFYAPRSVVRMMARLVDPQKGIRVYDPCSGSGGMLIMAKEYVAERGEDAHDLALCGREANGVTWAMSKLNMILHGIIDAELHNRDREKAFDAYGIDVDALSTSRNGDCYDFPTEGWKATADRIPTLAEGP